MRWDAVGRGGTRWDAVGRGRVPGWGARGGWYVLMKDSRRTPRRKHELSSWRTAATSPELSASGKLWCSLALSHSDLQLSIRAISSLLSRVRDSARISASSSLRKARRSLTSSSLTPASSPFSCRERLLPPPPEPGHIVTTAKRVP